MRVLVLCCLAVALAACDGSDPPESADAPAEPSSEEAEPPKAGEMVDAPAGSWTVTTHHPRLHQLDDAAWDELVMELLSGVVQTSPSDDGLRLVAMGRGSVAEEIGLAPGDVLTTFGSARPPSPAGLHRAWIGSQRTRWASLTRTRDGTTETIHVWLSERSRVRKADLAAALVHVGVVEQTDTRRLVDRSVLEALGETTQIATNRLLWHALGLPDGSDVVRVESENVGDRGRKGALELITARASERAFELLAVDRGRELRLQYEIVTGLVDESVLERIRRAPEQTGPRPARSRPLDFLRRPRPDAEDSSEKDRTPPRTIESKGEHHVAVKSADFDALLKDPATLARYARVVPSHDDGELTGYKLYGIRRQSLFGQLGFQNGDKITKVQGTPITSLDRAMEVFDELSEGDVDVVKIEVERRGEEIELRIDIE